MLTSLHEEDGSKNKMGVQQITASLLWFWLFMLIFFFLSRFTIFCNACMIQLPRKTKKKYIEKQFPGIIYVWADISPAHTEWKMLLSFSGLFLSAYYARV